MPGLIEEPVLTKKEIRKRKKEEVRKSKQAKKKEKQKQYESIDLVNVPERNLCMFHSIRRNVKIF